MYVGAVEGHDIKHVIASYILIIVSMSKWMPSFRSVQRYRVLFEQISRNLRGIVILGWGRIDFEADPVLEPNILVSIPMVIKVYINVRRPCRGKNARYNVEGLWL